MGLFDTIAAIATPAGVGGIGMVRVSGSQAFEVADRVFRAEYGGTLTSLRGYTARYGAVYDGERRLDEAVALVFRAPKSYTGEDVVELMCHGGEQVCASVLRAVLDAGATIAGKGEFTRRALVNGRISLTEAEAVSDMITASSSRGQAAAVSLAGGSLRRRTDALADRVLAIQAQLSAAIDFPEEDVEEMEASELLQNLDQLCCELTHLVNSYEVGSAVLRGVTAAIVGTPNVGKSTLLNLLAGAEKAIVTAIPGTTRDIVEQRVNIGGASLLFADTAGIREGADEVERIGVDRARERLERADIVLAVFDCSRPLTADDKDIIEMTKSRRTLAVLNKTDLPSKIEPEELRRVYPHLCEISAEDADAFAVLDEAIASLLGTDRFDENEPVLANERQRACAVSARDAVEQAQNAVRLGALDAAYAMLAEALTALMELSGQNVTETVLDEVFSRFCVGK